MIPAKLPTLTLTRGDIWEDVYHFGPMTEDNLPVTMGECLSCRMQFRNSTTFALGWEINSVGGTGIGDITIVDGINYEFDIPAQSISLTVGKWVWDFETFETDDLTGPARTWYTGTFVIKQDISHD